MSPKAKSCATHHQAPSRRVAHFLGLKQPVPETLPFGSVRTCFPHRRDAQLLGQLEFRLPSSKNL
jgi:hypothetical protein